MSRRGGLFRKYVFVFVTLVTAALLASGIVEIWFSYGENKASLLAVQNEQAVAAAARIEAFVKEIERQMAWTTQPQLVGPEAAIMQRRIDFVRLQKQVPAITELAYLDATGREQLLEHRLAMSVVGSGTDFSQHPKFREARRATWFGPVYFRKESEPYMTIAMPVSGGGVTVAEVNLKFIWDVVSQIKVGKAGRAFVVDGQGQLIAHPDISLVLQKTSLAPLPQVRAALAAPPAGGGERLPIATDHQGRDVLTSYTVIAPLRWAVFVEQPLQEAFAPLRASITRTAVLVCLGIGGSLVASVLLVRRMVRPIHTLQEGAARIGAGELGSRLEVRTGDELEALAGEFNRMTERLQESYATLERRVEERTRELSETLEQQTATSEILRVISGSPTDVEPVFRTILANATRLCEANIAALFLYDGEFLRAAGHHNATPEFADHLASARLRPSRETTTRLAALERRTIHITDLLNDPDFTPPPIHGRENVRTVLSVPMLREGALIGVITTWRREVRPFTDNQVGLVQTFADQAVIAIENVRLFTELQEKNRAVTEALEQQTATAEILRVISSSPTDVRPVFDAIARSASHLCDGQPAGVYRFDGEMIHQMALAAADVMGNRTVEELQRAYPMRPGGASATSRAILSGEIVRVRDVASDLQHHLGAGLVSFRRAVSVPMLRDGRAVGAITIAGMQPGDFPERQVEVLKTFADQAVIAIENVRLFTELQEKNRAVSEALEQQTATADILAVISSSPTDVQPVFEAIVQSGLKLFPSAAISIAIPDGDVVRGAAVAESDPARAAAWRSRFPFPLSGEYMTSAAILERRVVDIPDVAAGPPELTAGRQNFLASGYRGITIMPMIRGDEAIGALSVVRVAPGPLSEKQVAVLRTFADQAVIAIENVRLFTELQEKNRAITEALERQTATAEVLRVISESRTDTRPVFDSIVASAVRLCHADGGSVFLVDEHGQLDAMNSPATPELAEFRRRNYPRLLDVSSMVGRAIVETRVLNVPDLADAAAPPRSTSAPPWGSQLTVPIVRDGKGVGAIVVTRYRTGEFSEPQVELLKTFADQAVIAIENARLLGELQIRTEDLTRSVDQLTALGEVSRAVSSTLDLDRVLNTVVGRASELAGADGCSIYEYDEAAAGFRVRATSQLSSELVDTQRAAVLHAGEGAVGRLIETREPVQIPDIAAEHAYESPLRDALLRESYRALLAVPMLHEDRVVGGLVVSRKAPGNFPAETVELLKTFANQSALAIQNARLFREIEQKSAELEVANRHKSEFLASMSHELRTPLNAVIGFSEVLLERMFGDVNEKQEEYLRDIYSSGRHLLSLINDILDLAKIEAGRMELDVAQFDLPQAIENAVTLVRGRADAHGIRLEMQIDARLGDFVGDERKVKQILLNLLSNAVKFTPEGGRITLSATPADGSVEISVSDTGIGIAPEDQAAVFEEFRQVGTDYARKREGTGLGLALTKRFVELHGGTIWLKSAPDEGSTFTFTLPVRPWPTSSS